MGWLHGIRSSSIGAFRGRAGEWPRAALLEAGAVVVTVTFGLHLGAPLVRGFASSHRRGRDRDRRLAGSSYFSFELFGELALRQPAA